MTRGVPMIDPDVDLKGATPETLARALLRNRNLPRRVGKPVANNEVTEQEVAANKPGDGRRCPASG